MSPPYPMDLERWWVREASRATGLWNAHEAIDALEPDVARLSDLFTTRRPSAFSDYSADPRLQAAYGLFFFPRGYVRTACVLDELASRSLLPTPISRPIFRVLDLGCGLGAAMLAAKTRLQSPGPVADSEFTALDRSAESLKTLERLHADLSSVLPSSLPSAHLRTVCADIRDPLPPSAQGPFDLILLSFVLNEALSGLNHRAWHDWVRDRLSSLSPTGCMLIIEPAGSEEEPGLETLRDALLESDSARVLAPCLHQIPCPMLRENIRRCHEVRRWQVPESMERLNRHLFRSIQDLKFSFLALSLPEAGSPQPPPFATDSTSQCRLVAPISRQKGRLVSAGCFASGQLHDIELLTRHLQPGAPNPAKILERGDIVRLSSPSPIGDPVVLRTTGISPAYPESPPPPDSTLES